MGDALTSGDLQVGHNGLDQPMLVNPTEANNNTQHRTEWSCAQLTLVNFLNNILPVSTY